MRLIIGDELANGEFKKSVFERFSTIPFSLIQVRNHPFVDIREDVASAEETTDQAKGGSDVSNNPIRIPNLVGDGATTST